MRLAFLLTLLSIFISTCQAEFFPFDTLPELYSYLTFTIKRINTAAQEPVFMPSLAHQHTLLSHIINATSALIHNDTLCALLPSTFKFAVFQKKLVFAIEYIHIFTTRVTSSSEHIPKLLQEFEGYLYEAEDAWSDVLEQANVDSTIKLAYPRLLDFQLLLSDTATFLDMHRIEYNLLLTPLESAFYSNWHTYTLKTLHLFSSNSKSYHYLLSLTVVDVNVLINMFDRPMKWFNLGFAEQIIQKGDEDAGDSEWMYQLDLEYTLSHWNAALNTLLARSK